MRLVRAIIQTGLYFTTSQKEYDDDNIPVIYVGKRHTRRKTATERNAADTRAHFDNHFSTKQRETNSFG